MSIGGVGTDIVETARIRGLVNRYGDRFARRILTPGEQAACPPGEVAGHIAKRFAAKEAAAKALGCGLAEGVRFHDLEIHNQPNGRPCLMLHGEALARAHRLGVDVYHVTLSDERYYAIAFVILESSL